MSFVAETQAAFDGLITKPALKDKLLNKPPFRFLHDIVTNTINQTGFPVDLYESDKLNSKNVKTKDQKIAFLELLVLAVGHATGGSIPCRPVKVVQGLEPENTNALLQGLAKAARNVANLDQASIIAKAKAREPVPAIDLRGLGVRPSFARLPPPEGQSAPVAKAAPPAAAAPAADDGAAEAAAAAKAKEAERKKKEEAKRKEEARRAAKKAAAAKAAAAKAAAEKKQAAEADAAAAAPAPQPRGGGGGSGGGGQLPVTRTVIDLPPPARDEDFIKKTIRMLGCVIGDKPKLSAKLLGKPPFRFIHDCITNCIKKTGFPGGLLDEDELDARAIKTPGKLKFLKKLIECVATAVSNPGLISSVNPKRIAAGLEPENTNLLLQNFAIAAASGVDCAAVLERMNNGGAVSAATAAPAPAPASAPAPAPTTAAAAAPPPTASAQEESSGRRRKKEDDTPKPDMPKLALANLNKSEQEDKQSVYVAKSSEVGAAGGAKVEEAPMQLARPKTARKAPPKVKSNLEVAKKEAEDEGKHVSGVILDGEEVAEEEDSEPEEHEKLAGFEDPLAGGGADDGQHGKLVSDILAAQNKGKEEKEANKGVKFGRVSTAKKQTSKLYSREQILELRQGIQSICQSANPLGKCIDFVYDDMDQMNKELARWRRAFTQYLETYDEEVAATKQILEPLTTQLKDTELAIESQTMDIHGLKANILKNDRIIQQLLEQQASAAM